MKVVKKEIFTRAIDANHHIAFMLNFGYQCVLSVAGNEFVVKSFEVIND